MIPPAFAPIVISFIVAISILFMLIRPRNVPEVYWVSAGVVVLLVLRLITFRLAERAFVKALDVCLFLIGMMLLSELAREHGVFDWLSSIAIRRSKGSCLRLFALVYAIGTVVTILMSNDATAVVLTPAILAAVRRARVQPLPYLFVCAFIANAASFVLPISNPANLVVFQGAMPPLAKWMLAFGVPSLLSIATTFLVLRRLFQDDLRASLDSAVEEIRLNANGKLVVASVGVIVAVLLIASWEGKDLGMPTCLAALSVTLLVCLKEKANPLTLAREISWETLALVVGLFILVDAMEMIGAMEYTRRWLADAAHLDLAASQMLTGFAVGIANNLVNNLPLGLIAGNTVQASHATGSVANAVLIGVDLGPNLSITGSLATILWLIALRREKVSVSFWDFFRVGVIAMPAALFAALAGSILMQIWLHLS
ncbi:MAG TPA: arsenic transporter [Candidatus Eisenbacteria bacterium]|nr:arsenic transporter [Candidatus Eisenbacteria bacterium]